jgi:hypothetical protein
MLNLPLDEEKVETTRPVFIWLPPSPQVLFNNVLYDLRLVEVLQTQSSSSAIETNIPLYLQANINLTTQPFPVGYPELQVGKVYAWQIIAKNNNSAVSKSEIWTFTVKENKQELSNNKPEGYYSKLRNENDASYIICTGILHFELNNELNQNSIEIRITDLSGPGRKAVRLESSTVPIKLGQNFIDIDLLGSSLMNRHIYQLVVESLNKGKWFVKFEYRPGNKQ